MEIHGPLYALPLHASAVVLDGGAFLFLGPSGAGKSTVRRLLEDRAAPLADDAVFLRHRPGEGWGVSSADSRAFSGPLSEREAAERTWVPLRAFFRIHQAGEVCLEALPPWKACRFLVSAFFEVYWPLYCDLETKRRAFASLADLARAVPGYRLYFRHLGNATNALSTALRAVERSNRDGFPAISTRIHGARHLEDKP